MLRKKNRPGEPSSSWATGILREERTRKETGVFPLLVSLTSEDERQKRRLRVSDYSYKCLAYSRGDTYTRLASYSSVYLRVHGHKTSRRVSKRLIQMERVERVPAKVEARLIFRFSRTSSIHRVLQGHNTQERR